MHWIWEGIVNGENEAILYGTSKVIDNLRASGSRFDDGVSVIVEAPFIDINLDEYLHGKLNDNLIAPGITGALFSSKLRECLMLAGVDNIEYIPAKIINNEQGLYIDSYHVANIIGRINCVDLNESNVQMHDIFTDEIEFIDSLVLKESIIDDVLFFRLQEHSQVIVVHDKVKNACEQAGITGVKFVLPKDFSQ